jgi:hypothetical protein
MPPLPPERIALLNALVKLVNQDEVDWAEVIETIQSQAIGADELTEAGLPYETVCAIEHLNGFQGKSKTS